MDNSPKLLYRVAPHNGGVVFALHNNAKFVARIHEAIRSSNSWKEFRSTMPRKEYVKILKTVFDDADEPRPKGSDSFDGECIPGWSDGDYPEWLQKKMEEFLPLEVLNKYGRKVVTPVNGSYWHIPEENCSAVCSELVSAGWKLKLAQDLRFH